MFLSFSNIASAASADDDRGETIASQEAFLKYQDERLALMPGESTFRPMPLAIKKSWEIGTDQKSPFKYHDGKIVLPGESIFVPMSLPAKRSGETGTNSKSSFKYHEGNIVLPGKSTYAPMSLPIKKSDEAGTD